MSNSAIFTDYMARGLAADIPSASAASRAAGAGAMYYATDTEALYLLNGAGNAWIEFTSGISGIEVTDGTHDYTGIIKLLLSGATVSNPSSGEAEITITAAGVTYSGSPVDSLVAGSNVTMSLSGTALSIASTGGGGGSGNVVYFGSGAPSGYYNHGDMYMDTSVLPYQMYVQGYGAATPPALLGSSVSGAVSRVTSLTTTAFTLPSAGYIYVMFGTDGTQTATSVVSSSSLTYTKIMSHVYSGGTAFELWAAPAATAVSGETITITYSSGIDDMTYVVFGLNGVYDIDPVAGNPFTTDVGGGSGPTITVSTSNANDILIYCATNEAANGGNGLPSGFTLINSANNGGGSGYSSSCVGYQQLTSPVTGMAVVTPLANSGSAGIIAIAGPAGSPAWFKVGTSPVDGIPPVPRPAMSAMTWFNQGSATANDNADGPLTLISPAAGGNNVIGLEQNVPGSTPWTLTTKLDMFQPVAAYYTAGIYVRDSSDKIVLFGPQDGTIVVAHFNSPTSFNSNSKAVPWGTAKVMWMRLYNDGTNFNFMVSSNGADWLTLYSEAVGSFIGTPVAAGAMSSNNDSTSTGASSAISIWNFELVTGTGTNSSWSS